MVPPSNVVLNLRRYFEKEWFWSGVLAKLLNLVRLKNPKPDGSRQLAARFDSKGSVDRDGVKKSITCEMGISPISM